MILIIFSEEKICSIFLYNKIMKKNRNEKLFFMNDKIFVGMLINALFVFIL